MPSDRLRVPLVPYAKAGLAYSIYWVKSGSGNIARNSRVSNAPGRQRVIEWFDRKAMPAEKAADKIVKAIEHRRNRVVITPEAWVTDVIKRVYPPVPLRIASWAIRKSGLLH